MDQASLDTSKHVRSEVYQQGLHGKETRNKQKNLGKGSYWWCLNQFCPAPDCGSNCIVQLKAALIGLTELKIKKSHILGNVGMKFGKLLLSYFCKEDLDLKTGLGSETRIKLLHSIEILTQPLQHTASQGLLHFGVRKSDLDEKTIHFGRKFGMDHMLATALGHIAEDCLEKDKQYEAACLIFS